MWSQEEEINIVDRLTEMFKRCQNRSEVEVAALKLKELVEQVATEVCLEEFSPSQIKVDS